MTLDRSRLRLLLFDLDGVLLSEQRYVDAAALTVASLAPVALQNDALAALNNCDDDEAIAQLRAHWLPDEVIAELRGRAINSNWDKAYACLLALYRDVPATFTTVGGYLYESLQRVPGSGDHYLQALAATAPAAPDFATVQRVFQSFFLGDKRSCVKWRHEGLVARDTTLMPASVIHRHLQTLTQAGFTLGIGTGRPRVEAQRPLVSAGLWSFFAPDHMVTYDDVRREEQRRGMAHGSLGKPHPFTYLAGSRYFKGREVCVVGDSVADAIAAQAAGFAFIGVGEVSSFAGLASSPDVVVDNVCALLDHVL